MNIDQLKQMWLRLSDEGVIDENVRPAIRFAWEKSLALGLNPKEKCHIKKSLGKEDYKKLLERNKSLLDIAIPLMENVYSLMDALQFLVVLTDSKGYILKAIGDQRIQDEIIESSKDIEELWEGKQSICSSVNIALETNKPIQVIGAEHFHEVHHKWSCAAALIKYGKNRENAVKLLEYLTSPEAQEIYANKNYETPANPKVKAHEYIESLGTFKRMDAKFEDIGKNYTKASMIMGQGSWK